MRTNHLSLAMLCTFQLLVTVIPPVWKSAVYQRERERERETSVEVSCVSERERERERERDKCGSQLCKRERQVRKSAM